MGKNYEIECAIVELEKEVIEWKKRKTAETPEVESVRTVNADVTEPPQPETLMPSTD